MQQPTKADCTRACPYRARLRFPTPTTQRGDLQKSDWLNQVLKLIEYRGYQPNYRNQVYYSLPSRSGISLCRLTSVLYS